MTLAPFVDFKLVIILFLFSALLIGYFIWKEKIGQEIIIAFLFALFITSYHFYFYDGFNLMLGKINLFPLVAWTAGLVFLREFYEKISFKHKFLIATLLYVAFLLILEYVGYNFFNIQLASNYNGIFNFELMHAPNYLGAFYFLAGPLYLIATNYLKVK